MMVTKLLHRLRPDTLAAQITLLILVAIVAFQAIVILTFHILDVEGRRHIVDQSDYVASVILALDYVPVSERSDLIAEITDAAPYTSLSLQDNAPPEIVTNDKTFLREIGHVKQFLWANPTVYAATDSRDGSSGFMAVALRKGGYALVSIAQGRKPQRSVWRWLWQPEPSVPFLLTPWALSATLFFICTSILIRWASKSIVSPLTGLAKSAEHFPSDKDYDSELMEQGPREVRELTRSINRMQQRIRAMIKTRTYVLAAVSHDLRTIITRLNLRTEFIEDEELRGKMRHDIQVMDAMLYKNLQFLRAENDKFDYSLLDLDSVLHTVADHFADMGGAVAYSGGAHQMIFGSMTEIQRIFTNLVENAVAHASAVRIVLSEPDQNTLQIDVIDDGPGISDAEKISVFEPFVRGEPGRTMKEGGGFGLGLSIVLSLVKRHGGSITLIDHAPHGLIARVTLPRAYDEPGQKDPA